ncbi:L-seryl-tRNA(Sec) selenium transferase [Baekduia alba]|uniref:L-seryl-tRNA(Sec) selenium transferase n=1 Tax=Baekduia alba TaxID=2997333 RepID=UPI0023417485|nr:L-seryl-tRNA(Sec) selenium transferase [Baekduia alba]WCB92196.1 L-seryl-tRNA(Sec) selenium transferase [Baekduia alba]
MTDPDALRALPAVDRLAAALAADASPAEAVAAARAAIAQRRAEILGGAAGDPDLVARAREHLRPSLRRVLNATGVIIHTNLGRAPLAEAAAEAAADAARGYVNLELDLTTGRRGARDAHVAALLAELTGAEDALVVNNGAAATLLAAAALAGPGASVIVSRGQLVEIGGGFRIPDVVAQAGARLVEVGTTNRTRLDDYAAALATAAATGRSAVILRVHPSNFRTLGFVEDVAIAQLTSLRAPVVDDLGSGVLAGGLDDLVADEPPVRASVAAGAALVCFSGDKLLGGPQAGILVGTRDAIAACRRHPLARALRVGRLPMAALAATLALYRDPERARREIPVLAMLGADDATLRAHAQQLADAGGDHAEVVDAVARVGGGALPLLELPGPAAAVATPDPDALAARLRAAEPPLLARIADGRVVLDPRTLTADEVPTAAAVLRAALT